MVEIQRGRLQDQRKVEEYLERLGLREKKNEVVVNWEEVKEKGIARKD
jgi:hypothetical protein